MFFDADMAPGSEIKMAYKARPTGSDTLFEELDWIDFPSNNFINEDNYGFFNSYEEWVSYTARTTNEAVFAIDDTNIDYEFQSFKIRLRIKSDNSANTPRIRSLRVIADL